jgi:hypothetical protein
MRLEAKKNFFEIQLGHSTAVAHRAIPPTSGAIDGLNWNHDEL